MTDDGIEFAGVFFSEGGHDHAGFPGIFVFNDVAFALQPVQGTAHRGTAHGEMTRKVGFDDPRAGGKPAVNDEFTDFVEGFSQAVPIMVILRANGPFIAGDVGWHG